MLRGVLAAAAAASIAACAPQRVATATTAAAVPGSELPAGRGRQILFAACTSCHDLREVTKFRGYYNRAQWRDIVVTMVDYGAEVEKNDVEVLTDYLNEHLGRRVTSSSP